ncbi:sigma-54-dependent Fis family transcriptional regulator [Candidatus Peregrinibacteria bacterium]|nr:sigma-54-dependent Fis family transcriptional regulator [Candidatus Peregrinibacteria bacterium]
MEDKPPQTEAPIFPTPPGESVDIEQAIEGLLATRNKPGNNNGTEKETQITAPPENLKRYETFQDIFSHGHRLKIGQYVTSVHYADPAFRQLEATLETAKIILSLGNTVQKGSVLITGATGTGKEVIALALHEASVQSENSPFIAVNCGAIPHNLIESELFGYSAGAFTDAKRKGKKGAFEAAQGGTLFLDEIGDLPLDGQVKILRALQERKIQPLGQTQVVDITHVNIICATNHELEDLADNGEFRKDLLYRISGIKIAVPMLRDRTLDIPFLFCKFCLEIIEELRKKNGGSQLHGISPAAINALMSYTWPGNIRELAQIAQQVTITARHKKYIDIEDLEICLCLEDTSENREITSVGILVKRLESAVRAILENCWVDKHEQLPLNELTGICRYFALQAALSITDHHKESAGKLLGISRKNFWELMRKYEDDPTIRRLIQ